MKHINTAGEIDRAQAEREAERSAGDPGGYLRELGRRVAGAYEALREAQARADQAYLDYEECLRAEGELL